MNIRAVLLDEKLTEININMHETDEKDNYIAIARTDSIKVERLLIKPYLHDHFPQQITHLMYACLFDQLNMSTIRILDVDFPEKRFTYNEKTGNIEELLTPDEKKVMSELGGATKNSNNIKESE